MRTKNLLLLIAISLAAAMMVSNATGQSGGFIIDRADATTNLALVGSSGLNAQIAQVAPRFVIEYANGTQEHSLKPLPSDLDVLLQSIASRFVIEFANQKQEYTLSFPKGMIGDTSSPQVTGASSDNGQTLVLTSDEFAQFEVHYGHQSGSHPARVTDGLFYRTFRCVFPDFGNGETVYYQVRLTDRSGNVSETGEQTFVVQIKQDIFLPLIHRTRR